MEETSIDTFSSVAQKIMPHMRRYAVISTISEVEK